MSVTTVSQELKIKIQKHPRHNLFLAHYLLLIQELQSHNMQAKFSDASALFSPLIIFLNYLKITSNIFWFVQEDFTELNRTEPFNGVGHSSPQTSHNTNAGFNIGSAYLFCTVASVIAVCKGGDLTPCSRMAPTLSSCGLVRQLCGRFYIVNILNKLQSTLVRQRVVFIANITEYTTQLSLS